MVRRGPRSVAARAGPRFVGPALESSTTGISDHAGWASNERVNAPFSSGVSASSVTTIAPHSPIRPDSTSSTVRQISGAKRARRRTI
jgi:hypothetical protein